MKKSRLVVILNQQFPGIPKTRKRAVPRLLCLVFGFIAFAIAMWIHPFLRALSYETIWFQFAGAALLWWESNAADNIELIVDEFRMLASKDETRSERVIRVIGNIIVAIIWIMAILFVASAFWMLSLKDDFHTRLIILSELVLGLLLVAAAVYGSGKWIDQQFFKAAVAISKADALGDSKKAEQITRSMLRTIGFALVAIGTLLQIPPIAV